MRTVEALRRLSVRFAERGLAWGAFTFYAALAVLVASYPTLLAGGAIYGMDHRVAEVVGAVLFWLGWMAALCSMGVMVLGLAIIVVALVGLGVSSVLRALRRREVA